MEEHILVGLSSAPSNARIIRTAATMAAAFGGSFTALFVRTPNYEAMSPADRERLRANTQLAQDLGAAVETVFGDDVSYQIAEYARLSGVTKIVVGRSAAARKYPWSKPSLTEKLTEIAPNLDIHIIPDASVDGSYRPRQAARRFDGTLLLRDLGIAAGILCLEVWMGYGLYRLGFGQAGIVSVYLLSVLLTAVATSFRSSHVLSAVAGASLFGSCEGGSPAVFAIVLASALLMGATTERLKGHTRQSARASYRTNLLLETNQLLQKASSEEEILQIARTQAMELLSRESIVCPGVAAERKDSLCYPIKLSTITYGTVLIDGAEPLEAFENSVLLSILGECALALENSRNAREKEEAKLQAEHEKLRANLLRSISHDLRTPLTAISGNASILLSGGAELDAGTRDRMYGDIYDDSVWLYNLVENLLAVTKIEEGRMKLRMQPQLVEEIVTEALEHLDRKKAEHIITVTHEDDLLFAQCDARLIVQVVINLVDNAIKYTPSGSHIAVSSRSEGGMAVISVADNGAGIPDGEKEQVFRMFYTGSSTVADSRRSLGLGLSLCKSIAEAHGGGITVSDNAPVGAVFTVSIPKGEVEVHE